MANDQINLPSLVVILVLSGLIVRYLFFSSPPGNQQPRDSLSQMRQREAAVERIQQMFPQVDRRTILWDLQRNGGSIAATTEKILSGRMETVSPPLLPPFYLPEGGLRLFMCTSLTLLCSHRSPSSPRRHRALTERRHRRRSRAPGSRQRNRRNRT